MPVSTTTESPVIYLRMPNWVGDCLMCLPILHALLQQRARIVVCARPWAKNLLSAYAPQLEGIVVMEGKTVADATRVRQFRQQHSHSTAYGLILPDSLSSALVFKLAGLRSAGYRDEGRAILLKWPEKKPETPMHAVEFWYYLAHRACQQWQISLPEQPSTTLALQLRPEAEALCLQKMRESGLESGRFVLLAPTAKGIHKGQIKTWASYEQLYAALEPLGLPIIMCPPANEVDAAHQQAPTIPILPALPLDSFAALCQHAALVVCNDSGVSHLAAAVGAQQLSLFGVTSPSRTGPWSPVAHSLGEQGKWPTLEEVVQASQALLNAHEKVVV